MTKPDFWKWFDTVSAAAIASPVGQIATANNFTVAHTGGGCLAWERQIEDGGHLWICDEGNGLGDTPDEPYLVGLHTENGDFIEDECLGLALAIAWCEQAYAALRLARKWVKIIGGGFHPDTCGESYSPALTAEQVAEYNADMERLFTAPGDPYEYGILAMKEETDQ